VRWRSSFRWVGSRRRSSRRWIASQWRGPLGKDLHADGSRIRDSRGCSLSCSKKRVVVGDVEIEGDASEEFGVFRKLPSRV
jgi:hypothetical protein